MKLLEIINVDFSLRHFVLPLMEGARARGHEVVGACAEGPLLADVRARGFRIEPLPPMRSLSPVANARALGAARRLIRAERPDMVHAHMPIAGFVGRLAARLERVPRVAYTSHGFLFNQSGSPLRRGASLLLEWAGSPMTDVFMTVSEKEAEDARRLRIHRRATAVLNGRDPAVFRPDPEARARIRAELGVPPDRVVAVIVSRLVAHKGHKELLEAARDVPEVDVWVVGERLPTDRGEDLRALFARAELGDRLRLLGYRADVPAVLAAADIFVLPSHFEGLPMSVIEAMLTGLPVIATDVGGPREQVVPGVTGFTVPRGHAAPIETHLYQLATEPELRARMGAAGRERALALYDEAKVVARTLDVMGL
jgi:glycosyltransferase involved in cell wall biosynthesis